LWLLIAMTLVGSLLGASLLLVVLLKIMPLVIAAALVVVTIFSLTNRKAGLSAAAPLPPPAPKLGLACTFLLGIHGGFFSGGYVALLTAIVFLIPHDQDRTSISFLCLESCASPSTLSILMKMSTAIRCRSFPV
jgi:uncharacterized membrane protein YfcA